MAEWDIDVAAARGVISSTENQYSPLSEQERTLDSVVDAAATACRSAVISTALGHIRGPSLIDPTRLAREKARSATTNTAAAVEHYHQGDLEMASNANNNAAEAPDGDG